MLEDCGGDKMRLTPDVLLDDLPFAGLGTCLFEDNVVWGSTGCTLIEDVWYTFDSIPVWCTEVGATLLIGF